MNLNGRQVYLTKHAIEQYRDRCKPALDFHSAGRELTRLVVECGQFTTTYPVWTRSAAERHGTHGWVLIGDDVVFPVSESGGLVTCIVRGSITPETRARRRELRKGRKGYHRARKIGEQLGVIRRERKSTQRRERAEAWS